MPLDDLAFRPCAREDSARFVDHADSLVVSGARTELFGDRICEIAPPPRDITLGEQPCPQAGLVAGNRRRERAASTRDTRDRRCQSDFGRASITDRDGQIATFHAFGARACIMDRSEAVAVVGDHIAMLHCRRMVHAGDAPIDRYVVLEHLSEGGMGAIYVGKKLGAGGFEMEVVLKQLLPEFTQQEEFIDLFLREAKLSATLDHANIVHTIDLVTAGNEYFIVMEYLPGGDLRTLLKKAKHRGKRFSPAAAIYISREVLSALSYAHSKRDFEGKPLRLIHRDVSPSNILLSYAGEVKLTDFGIAKAATHTSLFYKVKGKIGYMSPEQAKSEPLDHRSDLYSLAVCMYEILTGERLFVAAGLTTSADEIYSQPVPQLSKKVPVPPELDQIMARALSIDPNARYQTAGELQEALMRCAHRNGLLMSAPELAKELRDACGPTDAWRGDEDDDDLGYVKRAGTEVYDAGEDEDEEDADDLAIPASGPFAIHNLSARAKLPPPRPPPVRPKTEIDKFNGIEMTSIINMMDLESKEGADPLVDLNAAPSLDSGPRLLDSAPRELASDPNLLPPPERGVPALPPPFRQGTPEPLAPSAMLANPRRSSTQHPQRKSSTAHGAAEEKSLRSWMVIVAILVAAAIAAGIVAMSGPDVSPQHVDGK
ncbi:MAG: serine/threonine protein kinase [Myxococcales bacterium]|nr:serine/threonine protein kinase [Myxococcales bacterium]